MQGEQITTRVVHESRMDIDGRRATVSREGRRVTISFQWAGRFTKDDQSFDVEDIKRLMQFVRETEDDNAG